VFNDRSSIATLIGILPAIHFKEKIKDVFVDVHGDIDNIIQIDFWGNASNILYCLLF